MEVYNHYCVRHEYTARDSLQFNRAAERGLDIIQKVTNSARTLAPVFYPHAEIPTSKRLWAEGMLWACDFVNRRATAANPNRTSPYEIWSGTVALLQTMTSFVPGFAGTYVARGGTISVESNTFIWALRIPSSRHLPYPDF